MNDPLPRIPALMLLVALSLPYGMRGQTRTTIVIETETHVDSTSGRTIASQRKETTRTPIPLERAHQLDIDVVRMLVVPNLSYQWRAKASLATGFVVQGPAAYTDRSGLGAIALTSWYPGGDLFEGFRLTGGLLYSHIRHDSVDTMRGFDERIVSDPFGISLSMGWQSDDPDLFHLGRRLDDDTTGSDYSFPRDIGMLIEVGVEWVVSGHSKQTQTDGGILINTARGVYPRYQIRMYGRW